MRCPVCGEEMERLPEDKLIIPYVCRKDGIVVLEFKVKEEFK